MRLAIFTTTCFLICTSFSYAAPNNAGTAKTSHQYTLPSEPDYESEKLRFQRATEPYYTLPQYTLDAAQHPRTRAPFTTPHNKHAAMEYQKGIRYARGLGVKQNHVQAHQWFLKAAAQNHPAAQVFLGAMSEQGKGTGQDFAQAQQWYAKAAAQNFPEAQFMLGLMYFQGKGVPQDYSLAREWLQKAAIQQLTPAQVNLGWLNEYGRGAEPDLEQARSWYLKAAESGDVLGQFDLGTLYHQGKGVAQDYAQARTWFEKAAEKNYAAAQYNLGVMALGQGSPRDPVTAYQWFSLVKIAFYPGAVQSIEKIVGELSPAQKERADLWVQQWLKKHPEHPHY